MIHSSHTLGPSVHTVFIQRCVYCGLKDTDARMALACEKNPHRFPPGHPEYRGDPAPRKPKKNPFAIRNFWLIWVLLMMASIAVWVFGVSGHFNDKRKLDILWEEHERGAGL